MTRVEERKGITIHQKDLAGSPLDYEVAFLGECKGVALVRRGIKDPHVCFTILGEDDGTWSESGSGPGYATSACWLHDLTQQIEAAEAWMQKHCKPDGQHGYKFRT